MNHINSALPIRFKRIFGIALTVIILGATIATSVCLGKVNVPFHDVVSVVWARLSGAGFDPAQLTDKQLLLYGQIVWQLRVPRIAAAAVAGIALAVAGAVLQAIVRNPLAEPSIMGASAGASLLSVAMAYMGATIGFGMAELGGMLTACLGALGALIAVLALSSGSGGISGPRVILTGVAVSQIAIAATSYLQLQLAPTQASAILFWLLGTVAGVDNLHRLLAPSLLVSAVMGIILLRCRDLDVLSVGDEDAVALGLSPAHVRVFFTVCVALLTGVAVSLAGTVSFLGLFVPHLVRFVIGPNHRWLIPFSAVWGAIVLVSIDFASRTLADGQELPLTVFTALIGGPVFLWLLRRSRVEGAA